MMRNRRVVLIVLFYPLPPRQSMMAGRYARILFSTSDSLETLRSKGQRMLRGYDMRENMNYATFTASEGAL